VTCLFHGATKFQIRSPSHIGFPPRPISGNVSICCALPWFHGFFDQEEQEPSGASVRIERSRSAISVWADSIRSES
jgi:hypothetical protein